MHDSQAPDAAARPQDVLRGDDAKMAALLQHYARTRDRKARQALILHHQNLVRFIALRFRDRGEELEDLVQVGTLGLIKAVDAFDPAHGVRFSTFAMPTILGEIKRHFRDHTWAIKVPRPLQELSQAARQAEQALSGALGRPPTLTEVAHEVAASPEAVAESLQAAACARTRSLDAPLPGAKGGSAATLADLTAAPDPGLHDIDEHLDLRRGLSQLAAREREFLSLRFFDDLSQRQIAHRYGVSQMQVSRLQTRALARLHSLIS